MSINQGIILRVFLTDLIFVINSLPHIGMPAITYKKVDRYIKLECQKIDFCKLVESDCLTHKSNDYYYVYLDSKSEKYFDDDFFNSRVNQHMTNENMKYKFNQGYVTETLSNVYDIREAGITIQDPEIKLLITDRYYYDATGYNRLLCAIELERDFTNNKIYRILIIGFGILGGFIIILLLIIIKVDHKKRKDKKMAILESKGLLKNPKERFYYPSHLPETDPIFNVLSKEIVINIGDKKISFIPNELSQNNSINKKIKCCPEPNIQPVPYPIKNKSNDYSNCSNSSSEENLRI